MIEVLIGAPWVIIGAIIVFVVTNPEKTEKLAGWLLGFLSWSNQAIRHRSIKSTVQGQINTFGRALNKEIDGSVPYNMKLDQLFRPFLILLELMF